MRLKMVHSELTSMKPSEDSTAAAQRWPAWAVWDVSARRSRVPARVHQVIFRVGRALWRSEAQELGWRKLSFFCLPANCGFLGKRFRPDVGGEQLRMPFFETEIGGALVAKEHVAVLD